VLVVLWRGDPGALERFHSRRILAWDARGDVHDREQRWWAAAPCPVGRPALSPPRRGVLFAAPTKPAPGTARARSTSSFRMLGTSES